jgi:hypothetical protein
VPFLFLKPHQKFQGGVDDCAFGLDAAQLLCLAKQLIIESDTSCGHRETMRQFIRFLRMFRKGKDPKCYVALDYAASSARMQTATKSS